MKGAWATRRETLRLEGWQLFIIASLFGWRWTATRARRFTTAYVEVPRKNGKSALAAPLLLYMLALDGEAGAECYSAATKAKQARIVFDAARGMARRQPEFTRRNGLKVQEHAILLTHDDAAVAAPLEAKKLDGLNAHCAVIDELHEHPSPAVFDALQQSRGARSQSLLLSITTAGSDLTGVCYQQHDYTERVLNGVVADDSYFGVIYAADPGDDPFAEETWSKANPNLGVSKRLQYMRQQAVQAKASPAKLGAFLTKELNIWTTAGVAAFDLDGWRAGEDPSIERAALQGAALGGKTGVDLALKEDFASVVTTWYGEGGALWLWADHFVTEAVAKREGNEFIHAWAAQGLVTMCPGALMDLTAVEACAAHHVDHFGSDEIVYDPQYAAQMAANWAAAGYLAVEFRPSPMNMDPPFQLAQGKVAERRVVTNGDPVLFWMASNTVVEKRGEFERPAKIRPANKIDGVAAWITALGRMQKPEEAPDESIYEHQGLLIL